MKIKTVSVIIILISIFMIGCNNKQNKQIGQNAQLSSINIKQQKDTKDESSIKTTTLKLLDYLKAPNEVELKGKVDNSAIHMTLHKSNISIPKYFDNPQKYSNNVITADYTRYSEEGIIQDTTYEGSYYYDEIKKNIKVIGILYQGSLFEIIEYDENNSINGFFKGYINSDYISGLWDDGKTPLNYPFSIKEYPFYLVNGNSKLEDIDFTLATSDIQALYQNKLNDKTSSSNIVIFNKTNSGFQFAIDAHSSLNSGVNIGSVAGTAVYTDSTKSKAQFTNENDGLYITFNLNNDTIVVNSNDSIQKYGGSNVILTGTFVKQNITK